MSDIESPVLGCNLTGYLDMADSLYTHLPLEGLRYDLTGVARVLENKVLSAFHCLDYWNVFVKGKRPMQISASLYSHYGLGRIFYGCIDFFLS